jgi:hypothetical protein
MGTLLGTFADQVGEKEKVPSTDLFRTPLLRDLPHRPANIDPPPTPKRR